MKFTLEKNENIGIDRDKLAEEIKSNEINLNDNEYPSSEMNVLHSQQNIKKGDAHE